jgi:anthranilate/para-aminobenzoate synthase component I
VKAVPADGLPRFIGGASATWATTWCAYLERLPATATRDLDVPDLAFLLPDTLVIFDPPSTS